MDESHKYYLSKRSQDEQYILYLSIFVKFKKKQTQLMAVDVSCDHWAWGTIAGKGPGSASTILSHLDDDRATIHTVKKFIKMYTYDLCIHLYGCYAYIQYTLKIKSKKITIIYKIAHKCKKKKNRTKCFFSIHTELQTVK